eukprot:m51a1_g6129 hypothetical protein (309) ;mRNA; r:220139-221435
MAQTVDVSCANGRVYSAPPALVQCSRLLSELASAVAEGVDVDDVASVAAFAAEFCARGEGNARAMQAPLWGRRRPRGAVEQWELDHFGAKLASPPAFMRAFRAATALGVGRFIDAALVSTARGMFRGDFTQEIRDAIEPRQFVWEEDREDVPNDPFQFVVNAAHRATLDASGEETISSPRIYTIEGSLLPTQVDSLLWEAFGCCPVRMAQCGAPVAVVVTYNAGLKFSVGSLSSDASSQSAAGVDVGAVTTAVSRVAAKCGLVVQAVPEIRGVQGRVLQLLGVTEQKEAVGTAILVGRPNALYRPLLL